MKNRTIIFEGPDCSGKSTAVSQVMQAVRRDVDYVTVWHHGTYNGWSSEQLFARYWSAIAPDPHGLVINDRSWFSEPIYQRVMRPNEPCRISKEQRDALILQYHSIGAMIVLCLPPRSKVIQTFAETRIKRDEYPQLLSQIGDLYDEYAKLHEELCMTRGFIDYDYTRTSFTELMRYINAA